MKTGTIFDEKRFNLGDPDSYDFAWNNLRDKRKSSYSRHSGGGGVMVWVVISWLGTTHILLLTSTVNSKFYDTTVEIYLLLTTVYVLFLR